MADREVHEDPYPSRFAMAAAVELEVHAALGRVQTQTVGKVIQRAIDAALKAHGVDTSKAAVAATDLVLRPHRNQGD